MVNRKRIYSNVKCVKCRNLVPRNQATSAFSRLHYMGKFITVHICNKCKKEKPSET